MDKGDLIQRYGNVISKAGGTLQHVEKLFGSRSLGELPQKHFEVYLFRQVRRMVDYGKPPNDLDDFLQLYGDLIAHLSGKNPLSMGLLLWKEKILRSRHQKNYPEIIVKLIQRILGSSEANFEYPLGFPKDDNELYQRYKKLVSSSIRKVIRWGIDLEEVEQEIWAKLIHTNVILKYLRGGILRRLPQTLSTSEAIAYLGITKEEWNSRVVQPRKLIPAKESSKTEYRTSEVQSLDNSGYFNKFRPLPRKLPEATTNIRKFEIYLRTAVQNHARNFLRTHDRRFYRDTPMQNPYVHLAGGGSLYQVVYSDTEKRETWEASLVGNGLSADSLCDAKTLVRVIQTRFGYKDDPTAFLKKLRKLTGRSVSTTEPSTLLSALRSHLERTKI